MHTKLTETNAFVVTWLTGASCLLGKRMWGSLFLLKVSMNVRQFDRTHVSLTLIVSWLSVDWLGRVVYLAHIRATGERHLLLLVSGTHCHRIIGNTRPSSLEKTCDWETAAATINWRWKASKFQVGKNTFTQKYRLLVHSLLLSHESIRL